MTQVPDTGTPFDEHESDLLTSIHHTFLDTQGKSFEERDSLQSLHGSPSHDLRKLIHSANKVLPSLLSDIQPRSGQLCLSTLNHVVYSVAKTISTSISTYGNVQHNRGRSPVSWQLRLEGRIKSLRAHVSRLTSFVRQLPQTTWLQPLQTPK